MAYQGWGWSKAQMMGRLVTSYRPPAAGESAQSADYCQSIRVYPGHDQRHEQFNHSLAAGVCDSGQLAELGDELFMLHVSVH